MCLSIGTPKILNFPFGTNGKLSILGVPIFKHIRVVMNFIFVHFINVLMPANQSHCKVRE